MTFPDMHTAYLPIVVSEPLSPASLGVQVDAHIPDLERWIVPGRMYQMPARWAEIEQVRGEYQIPANLWIDVPKIRPNPWILGTKTCPTWAQEWPGVLGSPPRYENWPDYAAFLNHMIDELHPWGVEIWNEPDTSPATAVMEYFGAWIDDGGDPVQAGMDYAEFCNAIYPLIKQAHPETQVIVGALMGNEGFLHGMEAGRITGDLLSIHHYLRPTDSFEDTFTAAEHARNVCRMPVIISETSIVALDDSPDHEERQAEYLRYLREVQHWTGIPLVMWYSLFNWWNYTALIRDGEATEVYAEFVR
jgi:hypothetical protein